MIPGTSNKSIMHAQYNHIYLAANLFLGQVGEALIRRCRLLTMAGNLFFNNSYPNPEAWILCG